MESAEGTTANRSFRSQQSRAETRSIAARACPSPQVSWSSAVFSACAPSAARRSSLSPSPPWNADSAV